MQNEAFIHAFRQYRALAERALEQAADADLNRIPYPEGNSLGMLVRHMGGNLKSRFTDFLTSDGEKPWRRRDAEFEERAYTREEMMTGWADGWSALESTLARLTDADFERDVRIRGEALSVRAALLRALAHQAYHVGQIVLLARSFNPEGWQTLSMARNPPAER